MPTTLRHDLMRFSSSGGTAVHERDRSPSAAEVVPSLPSMLDATTARSQISESTG